jgi:hypothetical protein
LKRGEKRMSIGLMGQVENEEVCSRRSLKKKKKRKKEKGLVE